MRDDEILADERLSAYVDGELDADARAEVEALLRRSPEARVRLDRFLALDRSLRELAPAELPPGLEASLRRRIDAEPAARPRRAGPPRRLRRVALAGFAAAAAAALALALLPRGQSRQEDPPLARQAPPPELARRDPAPEQLARQAPPRPPTEELPTPEDLPTAAELLLVSDLEAPEDLEVIELLDWLGELDALDRGGRG